MDLLSMDDSPAASPNSQGGQGNRARTASGNIAAVGLSADVQAEVRVLYS